MQFSELSLVVKDLLLFFTVRYLVLKKICSKSYSYGLQCDSLKYL